MKPTCFLIACFLILTLAACGPSPEEQAATAVALTAAAATNTPVPTATPTETPVPTITPTNTPTPTPTPVPFDLAVFVVDEAGSPIAGAEIAFEELGASVLADVDGSAAWSDLPGESVTLSAAAQGYLAAGESGVLEHGPNEFTITLPRDPFGILPADACGTGETLVYLEDFQDGSAPGWPEIEFQAQGWGVAEEGDLPGNMLALFNGTDHVGPQYQGGLLFENNVWRLRVRVTGQRTFSFNWLHGLEPYELEGQEVFDARYQIIFGSEGPGGMHRLEQPVINIGVASSGFTMEPGRWYLFEISTFEGQTQVWVDGVSVMTYTDPKPLGPGTIGLEIFPPTDPGDGVSFDDLSICGLGAPFNSIVVIEP